MPAVRLLRAWPWEAPGRGTGLNGIACKQRTPPQSGLRRYGRSRSRTARRRVRRAPRGQRERAFAGRGLPHKALLVVAAAALAALKELGRRVRRDRQAVRRPALRCGIVRHHLDAALRREPEFETGADRLGRAADGQLSAVADDRALAVGPGREAQRRAERDRANLGPLRRRGPLPLRRGVAAGLGHALLGSGRRRRQRIARAGIPDAPRRAARRRLERVAVLLRRARVRARRARRRRCAPRVVRPRRDEGHAQRLRLVRRVADRVRAVLRVACARLLVPCNITNTTNWR